MGYDLLHDVLIIRNEKECDSAYKECQDIVKEFYKSRASYENGSIYELLEEFVNDKVRFCSECGKRMHEGYVVDSGEEYYCSEKCLNRNYSGKDWDEMSEEGSDSYYTTWEE